MLTRDEKKPEDGIKFEGDDALDATRYLLYSCLRAKKPPQDQRMDERIRELQEQGADPTVIMILRRNLAQREERRSKPIPVGRRGLHHRRRAVW